MNGFWIRIAPHGHVRGCADAELVGLLVEDAHKEFTPLVADRRREAAEGWRHELLTPAEWDERAKPCLLHTCDHVTAEAQGVA